MYNCAEIIKQEYIESILEEAESQKDIFDANRLLQSVANGHVLNINEIASLLLCEDPDERDAIFSLAHKINIAVHGKNGRGAITFYGVMYISDFCLNTCRYCGDNITSLRPSWKKLLKSDGLSEERLTRSHRLLSKELFRKDALALLAKHPDLQEICILSGDTPGLTTERLIEYITILSEVYHGKIILNIPPLNVVDFARVKASISGNKLQFRVFQESYHPDIFAREHPDYDFNNDDIKKLVNFLYKYNGAVPTKKDLWFRVNSQARALIAGFDEVGLGGLFGLNDTRFGSKFEILALYLHAKYLYQVFGLYPASISFPRILNSHGVEYKVASPVSEEELKHLVAVTKLAVPESKLIITCRESAEFRRELRPIVNIEDFEARPGPGGNIDSDSTELQMEIKDRRKGSKIMEEMERDGYYVR